MSLSEGEEANDDHEEDDTSGEDVNLSSIIDSALMNLWSNICLWTSVRLKVVNVLVSGKAEVGQNQFQIFRKQDIL